MGLSDLQSLLSGIATEKRYPRHAFFLKQDAMPEHLGIVKEGVFREFSIDRKGKEHNRAFFFAGDFAGFCFDPPAELPGPRIADPPLSKCSTTSIQALTPGTLLLIPLAEFDRRIRTEETWLQAAHQLVHSLLMKKFEREYQLLTLSAQERYALLETAHPQLILEIPAFHLASYLGITPVSLSRLRHTRKHKNS